MSYDVGCLYITINQRAVTPPPVIVTNPHSECYFRMGGKWLRELVGHPYATPGVTAEAELFTLYLKYNVF